MSFSPNGLVVLLLVCGLEFAGGGFLPITELIILNKACALAGFAAGWLLLLLPLFPLSFASLLKFSRFCS